jgi:hypothetical protein
MLLARRPLCPNSDQVLPAACAFVPSKTVGALFGFTNTAIVLRLGISSRNSSNRFAASGCVKNVAPVTLPPGLLRLLTSPAETGSLPIAQTTGIVAVASFAARAAGVPLIAAITATLRPTKSAAIAGSCSYWPAAQRYSIVTLLPST